MGLQRNVLHPLCAVPAAVLEIQLLSGQLTVPAQADLFGTGRKRGMQQCERRGFDLHLVAISVITLGLPLETFAKYAGASRLKDALFYQNQRKFGPKFPSLTVIL